jgi:hypothetical protein
MVGQGNLSYSFKFKEKLLFMEPIISATTTGLILTVEGVSYLMSWIGDMLKVTGPDVCYYILETKRGLEQADCALQIFTVLIAN